MKSVLISIRPKWVEKIASRKKAIELRKTRPNIETPFNCYIYMTQGEFKYLGSYSEWIYKNRMKVVGEFVCDKVDEYNTSWLDGEDKLESTTCLDDEAIMDYMNNFTNRKFYLWHISELKIYDKPKELSEFKEPNGRKISRPPQSWQYVEEI